MLIHAALARAKASVVCRVEPEIVEENS